MWSLGIVRVGFVQDIANWYLQSTGGTPTDILKSSYLSVSVQKFVKNLLDVLFLPCPISKGNLSLTWSKSSIQLDSDSFGSSGSLDPSLYSTNEKASDLSGKILVLRGIQRVAYLAHIEITNIL